MPCTIVYLDEKEYTTTYVVTVNHINCTIFFIYVKIKFELQYVKTMYMSISDLSNNDFFVRTMILKLFPYAVYIGYVLSSI